MAFPINQLLTTTVETRASGPGYLPPGFWFIFTAVHAFHRRYWFWKTKASIWKMDNAFFLLQGAAIHYLFKDKELVKRIAKVIDVASCVLKAVEDVSRLKNNFAKLIKVIKGHYPTPRVKWEDSFTPSFFSPSTRIHFRQLQLTIKVRSQKIFKIALDIFRDIFLLSMHLLDAKQAYYDNSLQIVESVVKLKSIWMSAGGNKIGPIVQDLLEGFGVQGDLKNAMEEYLESLMPDEDSSDDEGLPYKENDLDRAFMCIFEPLTPQAAPPKPSKPRVIPPDKKITRIELVFPPI